MKKNYCTIRLVNPLFGPILPLALAAWCGLVSAPCADPPAGVVENLTFNGQADPEQASFILKGRLKGAAGEEQEPKLIYSVQAQAKMKVEPQAITQVCEFKARIYQGRLKEMALALKGEGDITQVAGADLKDWGIRYGKEGKRFLVLRPKDAATNAPRTQFAVTVQSKHAFAKLPVVCAALCFAPENVALFDGTLEVEAAEPIALSVTNLVGLTPVRTDLTPAAPPSRGQAEPPFRFRFSQAEYSLSLAAREKDPEARRVALEDFKLAGDLGEQRASFVLSGNAVVKHPEGGLLDVLSGEAALTNYPTNVEVTHEGGSYRLRFRQSGTFPLELRFNARVTKRDGWNGVSFEVAPASLRPITLKGLSTDTQFQFPGAAKPERRGAEFVSYLPSAGPVRLQWKEAKVEERGKLFYSAQGTMQIAVGPGLLRQAHLFEFSVMQGELEQLVFDVIGEGEVTRIRGEGILAWRTEAAAEGKRRLVVLLNQPCKDRYSLLVQTQTPLGAFPLALTPLRLAPAQAIRFGGHVLVANDGAVRLEVTEARGLSQISPELFPQSKELADLAGAQRTQAFAYRFSGADYALAIQADHILPELSVSELLLYHLGETETAIEAELELDIREAPLREFYLRVPADFAVSRLTAARLSDYFLNPDTEPGSARLRMVFGTPLTGRQVIQLRLEKNLNASSGTWALPALQPQGAKSVRGHVGVAADAGFRLTAERLEGLTEVASAYFPKKIAGLQLAYRLREDAWQVAVKVERVAMAIQADAVHLFTVSEGIAYGSSVINYFIAGSPIGVLRVEVPAEYSHVEFAGRDVRNWKQTDTTYEVYLHAPVFGTYTLLATFDRKFNAQSNTVSFAGLRPMDAQSEQGSVLVVSDFQFEVKPAEVSPGLIQLDPGEVPPEHRLLFDAPILAAYQYTSRPYGLRLALHSLGQGETVHQVVDRAALKTRVSREGEVVTEAKYFLKSKGLSHLRLTVPKEVRLWETKVNGSRVVPVADRKVTLIPLPAKAPAGALLVVDLKLAAKSPSKKWVRLASPAIAAPVLLTDWTVVPDEGYQVRFHSGTVAPPVAPVDGAGLAALWQLIAGRQGADRQVYFLGSLGALLIGTLLLRLATKRGTYRWSLNHWIGGGLGLLACGLAVCLLIALLASPAPRQAAAPAGLTLSAPVQEPGQELSLEVKNVAAKAPGWWLVAAWPALLGLAVWVGALLRLAPGAARTAWLLLGWTLICWAALRLPNGMPLFFGLLLVFLGVHVLLPALRCQWRLPRKVKPAPPVVGAATALVLFGLLSGLPALGAAIPARRDEVKSTVQSVVQQGRVQEGFVSLNAVLKWKTDAGQRLDFLRAPAVLVQADYPKAALQLSESKADGESVYRLTAKQAGEFQIAFQYQLAITKDNATNTIVLATPAALVNQLQLELERAEVEVFSAQAVSIQTTRAKRQEAEITKAELVLEPVAQAAVSWRPRARDTRAEKAVYYAELYHLFIPTAGVVEGVHEAQVRPAQGELGELSFQVPPPLTITDVEAPFVAAWRFDPDQHTLRVQFTSPQARPFGLRLRSQSPASPLPYAQTNGVLTVAQAASQVGMVGVATGAEVQLDAVKDEGLSAINLDDFPSGLVADTAKQMPGLTLRRAYRYGDARARLGLSASAVQPDVRVESRETLSLGEDRIVLASQLAVHIARAGIFKLSFLLPRDLEVESVSGAALSHWTELKSGGERVITLHLRGKTEGDQSFSITLAGTGMGQRKEYEAPRLVLREAGKQTGQVVIVPELGLRLHVKTRESVTQLDPQKAGVQQKGVMAFRLLQPSWQLAFEVETVEPWVQVTSLQDVSVREGQAQVTAALDYQVENAGVKSLLVQVPALAENVRFQGDLISDSVRAKEQAGRLADWEVKLQRRVIGNYALRVTYQLAATNQPALLRLHGVKAKNANLQRGYLAVRAAGRLELQFPQLPAALQRTEWQVIPAALRRGRDLAESKDTFNVLEADFELPVALSRHEVAKVLPARVERVDLTSVVAPSGEMLTETRLFLWPGDKRLLHLKLPAGGQFWYGFVNGQSAWPWGEGGEILLLLEKNSDPRQPTSVEFFYTCQTAKQRARGYTHQLLGPSFDLPLENITWRVFVPENWDVTDWDSTLQLRDQRLVALPAAATVQAYLQTEADLQKEQSKTAEAMLQMGNDFLQKGTPQQARRAYQAAWKLSENDAAFNEDARVQLHNLKMQQALLGLNQRRQAAFAEQAAREGAPAKPPFANWVAGQSPDYTQQQAQQVLEANAADDNAALVRMAERLIHQQDAGLAKPEAIRAALPAQGKQLTFTGSLQVESWADLRVKLDAAAKSARPWRVQLLALAGLFVALAVLVALTRRPADLEQAPA